MQIRKTFQDYLRTFFESIKEKRELTKENIADLKKRITTILKLQTKIAPFVTKIYQEIQIELPDEKFKPENSILDLLIDDFDHTLLMSCSYHGSEELVTILLEAKASPNLQSKTDVTALILAARYNHPNIIRSLVAAKANIEFTGTEGSALSAAIDASNLATVSCLLEHHAMIQNPEKLFEFLSQCDPRDPDVKSSLQEFCRQYPVTKKRKRNSEHQPFQNYLESLNQLEKVVVCQDEQRKINIDTVQDAVPIMPNTLADLIVSYQNPPLMNLSFFNANDINIVLNTLKIQKPPSSLSIVSQNTYIKLESIIEQLRQLGQNYLNHYPLSREGRQLKSLLLTLIGRFTEEYVAQKILYALSQVIDTAPSELAISIKKILMTYRPFSHLNLSEKLDKLIDPPLFECGFLELEHIIFQARKFGKEHPKDLKAAPILKNILSQFNHQNPLSEEIIGQELLKSFKIAHELSQSNESKDFITRMIASIPHMIERNILRLK